MMNLLKETEQDLRNLMLEVETLKARLETVNSENEKSHKQLLLGILEVVDSLEERLLSSIPEEDKLSEETKSWIGRFRMPYKKLMRILDEEKVVPIEIVVGEPVNSEWHQAIDAITKEGATENSICEIHKKGYLLKGKLLRNSIVTIVKNNS
jgi:molecular chaperone GrpE